MPVLYPILEFDSAREAMIEPSSIYQRLEIAEHCVLCFFTGVIASRGFSRFQSSTFASASSGAPSA